MDADILAPEYRRVRWLNGSVVFGNESPNAALIQMALAYRRSAVLCAAARLGVADALGDEVRDLDFLSKTCQADADALYRLLRELASLGVTEETAPQQFRVTSFGGPLRKDAPQSAWPSVIFLWGSDRR